MVVIISEVRGYDVGIVQTDQANSLEGTLPAKKWEGEGGMMCWTTCRTVRPTEHVVTSC